MSDTTGAVIVRPGEGTQIEGPVGGALAIKVRGEQTNGTLTALETVIPPDRGLPPLSSARTSPAGPHGKGKRGRSLGPRLRLSESDSVRNGVGSTT